MAALAQALERGYGSFVAREDEELATLRGRSDFQSLVKQPQAQRKRTR